MAMAGYLNGLRIAASKIGWGDVHSYAYVSDSIKKHENPGLFMPNATHRNNLLNKKEE